ncbi:hypothetical protein DMH18_26000 [Streptomyces sp. WAC 06783]|nr:hypothetical protein DMH18_26000 [Streptomyces sp. WAC 06783]
MDSVGRQALGKIVEQDRAMRRVGSLVDVAQSASLSTGIDVRGMTNAWARDVLGTDPFGLRQTVAPITDSLRLSIGRAAGTDRILQQLATPVRFDIAGLVPNPFEKLARPLSPTLPRLAEKLAELLFPANLQHFAEAEWDRLITMATDDGIGLMWAPDKRHLLALLDEPDRESRYAYLHAQREALFDEVAGGLDEIEQENLQDLAALGQRAIETARAGLWEAALSLATNVVYTAMETRALKWYHEEFQDVVDERNHKITGRGAGKTVAFVLDHVPMPPRAVGIFELRSHLVLRPLSQTFAQSDTVQGQHNRHAICHTASYASLREAYLIPALLNMHALLRGLNEKMADDVEEPA